MLDNVGGYQVDKVKFAMELHPHEAVRLEEVFAEALMGSNGPRGGKPYNVVSLKNGAVPGTYLYIFDVWGEAAQQVDRLDFLTWYPHLSRVDLKTVMGMTETGRDNYRDYLKEQLKGKRSVRLNDSPPRQKRGSRDAGGHTLALGSHKSDFRVHWTLRTDEEGYQEFQLEGSRIEEKKPLVLYCLKHPEWIPRRDNWLGFMQALLVSSQVELNNLDNLSDTERGEILVGKIEGHGIIERKLRWIEEDIMKLPRDAVYGLYVALEQKLFGQQEPDEAKDNEDEDEASIPV